MGGPWEDSGGHWTYVHQEPADQKAYLEAGIFQWLGEWLANGLIFGLFWIRLTCVQISEKPWIFFVTSRVCHPSETLAPQSLGW